VTWSKFIVDVTQIQASQHNIQSSEWHGVSLVLPSLQFGLRNVRFRNRKHKEILCLFYADGITCKLTQNIIKIVQSVAKIMGTNIASRYRVHFLHFVKKALKTCCHKKANKRAYVLSIVKLHNFKWDLPVVFSIINDINMNLLSNTTLLYTIWLIKYHSSYIVTGET